MEKIKLSIANNRSTNELVGYWKSKNGKECIVVTAYAVDDLQKKFDKELKNRSKIEVDLDVDNSDIIEQLEG